MLADYETNKIFQKHVPLEKMQVAISLDSVGEPGNYAWFARDALSIIEILFDHRIPILGGDVFAWLGNRPVRTYDNWYTTSNRTDQLPSDYLAGSKNDAINYINSFRQRNGDSFLYFLIVDTLPLGN